MLSNQDKKSMKDVDNKFGLVAEAGLPEARVIAACMADHIETKQALSFGCACVVPAADVLANTATLDSSLSDAQADISIAQGIVKKLSVDIAPMRDPDQLYRSIVYKPKKHAPVTSDTKRQMTEQRFCEVLCMQKGIVRIPLQTFNQLKKLTAMLPCEDGGAFEKPSMSDDLKHPLFLSQQEMPLSLRNGFAAFHLRRGESSARIQAGTYPRDLSRRCLWRASEACALLLPGLQWSCRHDTPAKREINEAVCCV